MVIKKVTMDDGSGRKTYEYDDRVSKKLQRTEHLSEDDAIEIAINRRLNQKRRARERRGN